MKICVLIAILATALMAQAPPPAAPDDKTVLTTIDGHDVTVGELRDQLVNAPPNLIQVFHQNPKYAIQQLYMMRYLAGEGDKLKLDQLSPLKEQIEFARRNAVAGAMVNHERDGFSVSVEDIKNFYDRNQSRYQRVTIKVIFLRFQPSAAAANASPQSVQDAAKAAVEAAHSPNVRSEAEARKVAADLVAKLRAGGDFAQAVADFSDDPVSKAAAGDFGVVTSTSSYADDLKKAVFALKAGEVSEPVRQPNGFYIIRAEEKSVQSMDEVTDPIIQEIRQNHLNEWFSAINKRFEPVVKDPEFFMRPDSIFGPPPAAKK